MKSLSEIRPSDRRLLSTGVDETLEVVCARIAAKRFVAVGDILGRSKHSTVTFARHEVMAELWLQGHAFAAIGRMMQRDHSTVMHGVDRVLVARAYAEREQRAAS